MTVPFSQTYQQKQIQPLLSPVLVYHLPTTVYFPGGSLSPVGYLMTCPRGGVMSLGGGGHNWLTLFPLPVVVNVPLEHRILFPRMKRKAKSYIRPSLCNKTRFL